MFDHIGILTTDLEKSLAFYEACLPPLGLRVLERMPEWGAVIFSGEKGVPFLFVGTGRGNYYATNVETSGFRPIHLSLVEPSTRAVDEFYRLGLANGGRDNGAPEDCGNGYYAAYLLDPDGNNIEAGIRQKK